MNPSDSLLALRAIPEKTEYPVGEQLLARVEFTNHSDHTFCFPPPDLDCTNTRTGSVIVTGISPPGAPDSENFICHIDGQGWREELLPAIKEKWIKIPPGGVYSTKLAVVQAAVRIAGSWRLKATYRPPEAHFGNAVKYRQYLQAGAQQAGCVIPERLVSGDSATINVVPKGEEK